MSPDGTVSNYGSGYSRPESLAFDTAGNLYVANTFGSSVKKVGPVGIVLIPASLDEFSLWTRALNATEIAALAAGRVDTSSSDLALYLPFNEGIGTVAVDHSRYGRDAAFTATVSAQPAWTSVVPSATPASFRFPDNGNYQLSYTVTDKDGATVSKTQSIAVNNVAPNVGSLAAPAAAIGQTLRFSLPSITDLGALDTQTYNWQVTTYNGQQIPGTEASVLAFTPQSSGRYVVTLTVTDSAATSTPQTINVNPVAVISGTPTASARVGEPFTLDALASSAPPPPASLVGGATSYRRTFTWTPNANLGTVEGTSLGASKSTVMLVPSASGTQSVSLIVTDIYTVGGVETSFVSAPATANVTVVAAASATVSATSTSPNESTSVTLTPGGLPTLPTVPGGTITRAFARTVTPNGNSQTVAAGSGSTFSFIPFDDPGSFTVNLTVTDTFGDKTITRTQSLVVDPGNVAPTVVLETDGTLNFGGTDAVRVLVTDPGRNDTFTVGINWGDGTAADSFTVAGTQIQNGTVRSGSQLGTHTYASQGNKTVTVTVTDKDGGATTQTTTLLDATAPTASLVNVTPDPRKTTVGSVTVNFSEPVTGVDVSDFVLTRDGQVIDLTTATPAITVTSSGNNVSLNNLASVTGTGGAYRLTLTAAGSGITDSAGNLLTQNTSTLWGIDIVAPTAPLPAFTETLATAVGLVSIKFSEPVLNFDRGDLVLTRGGTTVSLASASFNKVSDTEYTLDLSSVTNVGGSYVLTLNSSDVRDAATNTLVTTSSSFTIESVAPTATVLLAAGGLTLTTSSTSATTYEFINQFLTLTAARADAVSRGGWVATVRSAAENDRVKQAASSTEVWLGGSDETTEGTWVWTNGPDKGIQFWNGAFAGSNVGGEYANWNPNEPNDFQCNEDGMILTSTGGWNDLSVSAAKPYVLERFTTTTNSSVGSAVIEFTEPVSGFDLSDLRLTRDSTVVSLNGLTHVRDGLNRYRVDLSSVTSTAGVYSLSLIGPGAGVTDRAGNSLISSAATGLLVDKTTPTISVTAVSPAPRNTAVGNVAITASEATTSLGLEDFTLTRDGQSVDLSLATLTSTSATAFQLNLETATKSGTLAVAGTYVLTLNAANSGLADLAGNALTAGFSTTFTIDTLGPIPTLSGLPTGPTKTSVGVVTVDFNETATGVDRADFELLRDGTAVSLSTSTFTAVSGTPVSGTRYTLDLTSATSTAGNYQLRLKQAGSIIAESLGNAMTQEALGNFVVDKAAPTATLDAVAAANNFGVAPVVITRGGQPGIRFQGENAPNETAAKLFDGNSDSKWFHVGPCTIIGFNQFGPRFQNSFVEYETTNDARSIVTSYSLTSANDAPERDPANFRLLATNVADPVFPNDYVVLDERTNVTFASRFQTKTFHIRGNNTAYHTYRLVIDRVLDSNSAIGVQLAGWDMFGQPEAASSPAADFKLGVTFNLQLTTTGITDIATNAFSTSVSRTWKVDTVAPTATLSGVAAGSLRNSAVGVMTLNFAEPVTGVDRPDLTLTRNGQTVDLGGLTLNTVSATQYTIDLTSVTGTGGDYRFNLRSSNSGIKDPAGNPLATDPSVSWTTDRTAPTATVTNDVGSVTRTPTRFAAVEFSENVAGTPNVSLTRDGNAVSTTGITVTKDSNRPSRYLVTITFNEAVSGVDINDFTLTRDGAPISLSGLSVTPVVSPSNSFAINLSTVTTAAGSYVLTLKSSGTGITDAVGNPLTIGANDLWTQLASAGTLSAGGSYTIANNATTSLTLSDDATVGNGRSRVSVTGSRTNLDFANPSTSLTLNAGSGNDTLNLTAIDSLFAAGAALTINGEAGNDTFTVPSTWNRAATFDGGAGTNAVSQTTDLNLTLSNSQLIGGATIGLANFLKATLTGGTGNNRLDASAFSGAVSLSGLAGNDTLIGGAGKDTLVGGDGDDVLQGNGNNDSLKGDAGTDKVVAVVNVNLILTNTRLTGEGTDTLEAIEQADLTGGSLANTLNASAFTLGSVTLSGGGGNDSLTGGSGADLLNGGDRDRQPHGRSVCQHLECECIHSRQRVPEWRRWQRHSNRRQRSRSALRRRWQRQPQRWCWRHQKYCGNIASRRHGLQQSAKLDRYALTACYQCLRMFHNVCGVFVALHLSRIQKASPYGVLPDRRISIKSNPLPRFGHPRTPSHRESPPLRLIDGPRVIIKWLVGCRVSGVPSELPFCGRVSGVLWRGNSLKGQSMAVKENSFRVGKVRGDLRGKVWYLTYFEEGRRRRPRAGSDKEMAAQIHSQLETGAPAALSFEE